ncbi:MAG: cold shock domain-containing protein [Bacteriovoracaceae bacterium]|nr:cold shock domain-containing protein [Bacteriovoracaceae bacterium]
MFTGEVKFFDDTKGFGFIAPDEDMDDLFFHGTAVSGDEVTDEDRVEFELSESPKGPCAIHVKKI